MRGFTLIEMLMVIGIAAAVTSLFVFIPGEADNSSVHSTTVHLLKSSIARARTEALARGQTVVLSLQPDDAEGEARLKTSLVALGPSGADDLLIAVSFLPKEASLCEDDFPLNAALNEPMARPGSPLDGRRAYFAFNGGGALVAPDGGAIRCNLRLRVKSTRESSDADFGVNRATGIVQDSHLPPPSEPPAPSVKFAGLDAATRGNWTGKYGASGRIFCNYYSATVVEEMPGCPYDVTKTYDFSLLPDYVADYFYDRDGAHDAASSWGAFQWGDEIMRDASGHAASGLLRPDGARMSASVMALDPKSIRVTFTLRDRREHVFSIYATENTQSGRYMTVLVEPLDESGNPCGEVASAQCTADEYYGGAWFRFRVVGSFRVTLKNMSATSFRPNTFVSGFFFDEPDE